MSSCCASGADARFSKSAGGYARRYQRRGLDGAQKHLRRGMLAEGIPGRSVLDVGCGVGGLLIELLRDGASSGLGIDVSRGMIEKAASLAGAKGVSSKARFQVGDYAAMESGSILADIVVMDKVLCCTPDPETLVARASASGADLLAVSYPRDGFLARASFTSLNFLGKLLRWSFFPFYHHPDRLDGIMAAAGFRETRRSATPFWQIVILKRT